MLATVRCRLGPARHVSASPHKSRTYRDAQRWIVETSAVEQVGAGLGHHRDQTEMNKLGRRKEHSSGVARHRIDGAPGFHLLGKVLTS